MNHDVILLVIVSAAYISIALELALVHVPSVASNVSIWRAKKELTNSYSASYQRIFLLAKPLKILLFLPLLGVYFVFLLPFLLMLDLIQLPLNPAIQMNAMTFSLGVFFIVLGRCITLSSVYSIRQNNSQHGEDFTLHTTKVFRNSRNPTQLGMYTFYFGIVVSLGSVWLLLGLFYYIAYMHVKIKMEEDFLLHKYGDAYQHYMHKTGRYWS
ncbi:methyltransferase [Ningiella sp. W23]|uniref:methyltransferase n=1 Tax=Ningiella sp. W23 TaxID=3023715 RepID=UPI0037582C2F